MTDRHVDVGAVIIVDDRRIALGGAVLVVSHASTLSVRRCSPGSEPIAGEYPRRRLAGHVGFERRIDRHDLSLGSKAEQEAFEPGDRRDCQRDDEVVAIEVDDSTGYCSTTHCASERKRKVMRGSFPAGENDESVTRPSALGGELAHGDAGDAVDAETPARRPPGGTSRSGTSCPCPRTRGLARPVAP